MFHSPGKDYTIGPFLGPKLFLEHVILKIIETLKAKQFWLKCFEKKKKKTQIRCNMDKFQLIAKV